MFDQEETTFGQPFSPELSDEAGAPHVCTGCGGVNTVHMYHNIESDELTVECEDCGREYDSEQAHGLLGLLGEMMEEE